MQESTPDKKAPLPPQDEYILLDGKKIAVGDLTEAQAKEIVRMMAREKRMLVEYLGAMFGGAGLHGLFPEDEPIGASILRGPTTMQ